VRPNNCFQTELRTIERPAGRLGEHCELVTLACWLVLAPIAAQKDVSAAPSETLRTNILIILTDDIDT